jgi:signal transduction histidine kinase
MVNSHYRPERVLVAGFPDRLREQLAGLLQEEHFDVIKVDQSRDALAWFQTRLVDVAIVEAALFEGFIMDHMQHSFPVPPLPIVVCRSTPPYPVPDRTSEPQGLVVLAKPFTKRDLLAAMTCAHQGYSYMSHDRDPEPQNQPTQRLEFFGRLAAGAVHDFNNLLTVILGAGEILAANLPADDSQRIFVEQIQQAAQKGATLIHQLKALSKNQLPHPRLINLNQIVDKMNNLIHHLMGRNIALDFDLRDGLDFIEADPGQMEQVIMNLVLNARDAMPGGGTLRLSTSNLTLTQPLQAGEAIPAASYVVLTVSDNGMGMDEHTLTHLFEPFFTTKGPSRGSGLGLVNVHSIVKGCGGHIAVSSKVHQGTSFNLFFPRADQPAMVSSV